jgi:transposase
MSSEASYVGIDVSKEWIDAHILPSGKTWHVDNTPDALKKWAATLPTGIELVVIEATGGLHNSAAAILVEAGFAVSIVNPKAIHHFAKAMQCKAKTDAVDARLIATFAQMVKPTPRPLPTEAQAHLKELATRRNQLITMRTAEKNRLGTASKLRVQQSISAHLTWIEAELNALDKNLDDLLKCDESWKKNLTLLTSVPGVGIKTARMLIAQITELGTLTAKQSAALGGLAPCICQSGKEKGHAHIHGGRSDVRNALYMAAFSASRFNPVIRNFFNQLTARGKCYKVAITACMHKLLTILNAILRDQKPWKVSLPA